MFGNSSSGSLVIPELFTWSETIASLITLLCFAIAGITLSWAINRYIHKWVGGTSNNYDDLILQSVRGPITWELILFGLLTTTQTTSYIGDVTAEAAFSIIQALMIVVAALGVQKIIT
jgi:hypothetical protein